jgi:hypothetical protein
MSGGVGPRRVVVGLSILLVTTASGLAAQRSSPDTVVALQITEEIRLDGSLTEPAWQRARRVTNFTQREPDFGVEGSERTEVALLFDSEALYVGFWGFDSDPSGIRANEMARDFNYGSEDNFEFVLDPFDDDRNGYLFVTNANGARADALLSGGRQNRDWDGVWDVRSRRTEEGWFAEVRIPFATLRFPSATEVAWGVNFERNIRRKQEQQLWQGWSRDANLENLGRAGALVGILDVTGTRLAELKPFALGGAEWQPGVDASSVHGLGMDVSFLPVPNWKVNVTVRPDFAQVESDRQQVNLTRFSLFYPEKRTFFLEGSEFFAFDLGSDAQPFYSRRIGLAADRSEIPITGGARVLGKSGGTSIGAMALRTESEGAEPATDYGVVRWKRDLFGQSSVGVIGVGMNRPGRQAATYGFDARYATSSFFGDKELQAGLVIAQTWVSDGDQPRGIAHRLFLDYPNDLVLFQASWARTDSTFDPAVGYLRRSNYQRFNSKLTLAPRPTWLPFVRQLEIKPWEVTWYVNDRTLALESFAWELRPLGTTFRSGDSFELNLKRTADVPDEPFDLVDGVEIPAGTYWFNGWELQLESYRARRLSGSIEIGRGDYYLGTRHQTDVSGRWKASKHASFSGSYSRNQITFLAEDFTVIEASVRLDYAVTPTLFGSVATQWNDEDDQAIVNFRLNWIPAPGSDLFLVINQLADSSGDRLWRPLRTTAVSKLVWRIAL